MNEPPCNLEAEAGLIAACLIDGGATLANIAARGATPAHFHDSRNAELFAGMLDLAADGRPVDSVALIQLLQATGRLEAAGGYAHFTEATSSRHAPTTAHAVGAWDTVLDCHLRRLAIRYAEQLTNAARNIGEPLDGALSQTAERLLSAGVEAQGARSWRDAVAEAGAAIENDMRPPKEREARGEVSWGFHALDRFFCPMEPGELVTIAARTAVGKSSLARQVVLAAAQRGDPVLLHSLEVNDAELARNLAANLAGVRSRRELHKLAADDKARLRDAVKQLAALPMIEVRDREPSILRMIGTARAFKRRYGLRLWCIDYLGLINEAKNPERGQTAAFAIGRITSALKRFANEERCVVMLCAQINRAGDNPSEAPMLSHLKDSGSIEEDSNRVILIHRPDKIELPGSPAERQDFTAPPDAVPKFFCRLIQAKGRNHGTAEVAAWFHRETASFGII